MDGNPWVGAEVCPGRPRPSPPRRGRGRRYPRPKALLSSYSRAEPRGGRRRPPPNRNSRSIYLVPRTEDPFSSRRDGPRLVRYDARYAPPRSLDGLPELVGEGQTRRPACAAARWADAPLYATRPARLESIYDGPDPGTDGTAKPPPSVSNHWDGASWGLLTSLQPRTYFEEWADAGDGPYGTPPHFVFFFPVWPDPGAGLFASN